MNFFEITSRDSATGARTGKIYLKRGIIETPVFMPVGTKGTVKAITFKQLNDLDCRIILGNLYHLYLQPGLEVLKKAGGLHKFINWDKNILTDSGGFQVFSLEKIRKISDDGVEFKSVIDGSTHFFSPETVMDMQHDIGSDISMVLDECIPYNVDQRRTEIAAKRTLDWAERSLMQKNRKGYDDDNFKVFGIVQGGFIKNIRRFCAESISEMNFDGIAVGGLSVGEQRAATMETLNYTINYLDRNKPLYFMGLGDPIGIIEAIENGIDMFDCVMPTRISRNGSIFTSKGKINIKNKKYTEDFSSLDENCSCYTCKNYSKSYLKHLYKSREILSSILLTLHNLYFMFNLIEKIREAIKAGKFTEFKRDFINNYKNSE